MAALSVERNLEQVLHQTREQVDAGVWTLEEAAQLLQRRRAWECSLARLKTGKTAVEQLRDTFKSYITYEVAVLELIRHRFGRLKRSREPQRPAAGATGLRRPRAQQFKVLGKMRQRVFQLYERAISCRSLRTDESLWLAYMRFAARTGEVRKLRPILVRAMHQVGPYSARIFAVAAALEADVCGSISTARAVYLRGLRHHDQNAELWAQYVIFEVTMALKRIGREAVLQDVKRQMPDAAVWQVPRTVRCYALTTLTLAELRQQFHDCLESMLKQVGGIWQEDPAFLAHAIGVDRARPAPATLEAGLGVSDPAMLSAS
jgi:hypothetical protein